MSAGSRSMSAIPPEELPILESLINIRNRLTALKKNSSEFVRAQDVQTLYQAVIKQVSKLNAVRDEREANHPAPQNQSASSSSAGEVSVSQDASGSSSAHQKAASSSSSTSAAPRGEVDSTVIQTNRVDTTLQDVFSLLSLFFLTIGKSRETPATFSQLGSMKQLLDHLAESGIYTEADLQPFAKRLSELRDIIKRDTEQGKHPVQLTKLMMRKLEGCEKVLQQLQGTLSVLSVELVPIHQKLVSIRRQIAAAAAKPKPARQEIRKLQEELRNIDAKRVDGKFLGPGGSSVPAGQAILMGLMEECFEICHDVVVRNDEVPMTLQPIYDRLSDIKGQLEHLVLTHRWTLRETDLWNFQVTLKEIDRLRVDGKFVDSEGKQPEGQPVLLYLLRRCYGLIYRLVASSEPISEELMPISNKLSTVSKCLKEVSKYGGPFTMRDLYPYRLALHQIENMKSPVLDKDGNDTGVKKWLGRDGSVPEGQAILRAQFEEVEQTINEMLNQEEDSDAEDGEEESAVSDGWASEGSSADSDEDDGISRSASGMSRLTFRDMSLPTSPTGEGMPNTAGLSFSSLASTGGAMSPSAFSSGLSGTASPDGHYLPPTPQTARPDGTTPVAATFAESAGLQNGNLSTTLSSPGSVRESPRQDAASSLATSLLPPGAATLAVPVPGQNSLTAAAVSLESMQNSNNVSPLLGGATSPSVMMPGSFEVSGTSAEPKEASPGGSASADAASVTSAGASIASNDTAGNPVSNGKAALANAPINSPFTGAGDPATGSVPISSSNGSTVSSPQHACKRAEEEAVASPGSLTGSETKEDIVKQLEAKLALEGS